MSYPPPKDWPEPRPFDQREVRYYDADPTPPHGIPRSIERAIRRGAYKAFAMGLVAGAASASIMWWAWRGLP